MGEGTLPPDPRQPAVSDPALAPDPAGGAGAQPQAPAGAIPQQAPAWPPPPATAQPTQQAPAWPPPPVTTQQAPAWPPPPVTAQPAQQAWPPPPATAQPAQQAWPPPPAAAYPGAVTAGPTTSVLVVLAGIFLLIVGILTFGFGSLFGLLGGLFAAASTSDSELAVFGPVGSFIAGLAFVVVFWGILEIVASIGMFLHRGWGRAIGLVVGVVGLIFGVLALLGSVSSSDATTGGIGFSLVFLAGYGLTVLALVTGGEHFRRRA